MIIFLYVKINVEIFVSIFFRIARLLLMYVVMLSTSVFSLPKDSMAKSSVAPNLSNLVVLQYHHVSDTSPAITSTRPAVFAQHMKLLNEHYNVIDLDEALQKIKNDEALPDKSVAITFDDGYLNILENAHPLLSQYNFPYTVFINPAIIGNAPSQLNWQQIKNMQSLATFANHTMDHKHLLDKRQFSNQQDWLEAVIDDINEAEKVIFDELGYSKKWIAFPFGEYNNALKKVITAEGFIGFGQQSGSISQHSDFAALPRFPAGGIYANIETLKTKLNSLAMPATLIEPKDTQFSKGDIVFNLVIQLNILDMQLNNFACYFMGEKLSIDITDTQVSIPLNYRTKAGRTRVNCTVPSRSMSGRFYWYSYPMFTATPEGEYLD